MARPTSKPHLALTSAHNCDQAAGMPSDHWSPRSFTHIYCSFDDAGFADLYHDGGRYPISPRPTAPTSSSRGTKPAASGSSPPASG